MPVKKRYLQTRIAEKLAPLESVILNFRVKACLVLSARRVLSSLIGFGIHLKYLLPIGNYTSDLYAATKVGTNYFKNMALFYALRCLSMLCQYAKPFKIIILTHQ